MAKLENSTINKEELLADIEALKNASNDDEIDAIMEKYDTALVEMDAAKASETEEAAEEPVEETTPVEEETETQTEEPEKEAAPAKEKAPAKKKTTKKASEPKKEEEPKKAPTKKTAAKATEAAAKAPAKKAAPKKTEAKAEAPAEEPAKKGRTYNGKYEVFQVADGYSYHLKASNGEILVTSETYTTRDGVLKAIDAVKRNLDTGDVRIFADKRGRYKFKLVSKNYRVLVISANYGVEKSAQRAAESFKKFAVKADIVDIELEDADAKTATPIKITSTEDKSGGKYVIEKFNGEFSWDLKATNGQILCQAEGYTSKAGVLYSIEKFKKCVAEGTFKCVKDKTGKYMYKLYTPAGRICAIGESYPTKGSAESSANSVVSFYKLAEVVELKEDSKEDK